MNCMKCNQVMTRFDEVGRRIPMSNNIICIYCSPNRIQCECGSKISINSVYRHYESRKHLTYIEQIAFREINFRIDLNN